MIFGAAKYDALILHAFMLPIRKVYDSRETVTGNVYTCLHTQRHYGLGFSLRGELSWDKRRVHPYVGFDAALCELSRLLRHKCGELQNSCEPSLAETDVTLTDSLYT